MPNARRVVLLSVLLVLGAVCTAAATTLRISLPPVFEALPIAFGEAWGMFDDAGLSVELIGITNDQDRSQALHGGSLDAVMSDLTTAVLEYDMDRSVIAVAAAGSVPPAGSNRVALLSYSGYGPNTFDELLESDQYIGVMYQTDEEYLLDQLFAAHSNRPARVSCFADRVWLATLFGGKSLPLAVLPEPYTTYIAKLIPASGVPAPLIVLSDFSGFDVPPRVLLFRVKFLEQHPDEVSAFLRVYNAAVERMNAAPRDEIMHVGLDVVIGLFFQGTNPTTIQQQVLDAMSIPQFDRPAALSEDVFDAVTEWMADKNYIDNSPAFEDFTDFTFLP